jgi:predicted DNA-binding WGR domain protein
MTRVRFDCTVLLSKGQAHMARYEFHEGTSNKFWQIDLDGTSFTTTFGKVGTSGQSSTKSFDSEAKANAEHDKLVREKTGKGYGLVDAAGDPQAARKATARASSRCLNAKPSEKAEEETSGSERNPGVSIVQALHRVIAGTTANDA